MGRVGKRKDPNLLSWISVLATIGVVLSYGREVLKFSFPFLGLFVKEVNHQITGSNCLNSENASLGSEKLVW